MIPPFHSFFHNKYINKKLDLVVPSMDLHQSPLPIERKAELYLPRWFSATTHSDYLFDLGSESSFFRL